MNVSYQSIPDRPETARALDARLHCGLKLFSGSKIDDGHDIPPCVVKWICRELVRLGEALTQMEKDFAATGLLRKGAKPATACKKCDQEYCAVRRTLNKPS